MVPIATPRTADDSVHALPASSDASPAGGGRRIERQLATFALAAALVAGLLLPFVLRG